jgi:hypothetical protein
MISEDETNEKINQGWIKTGMFFEVLAVNEDATRKALDSLMNKLEKDERVKMFKKQFSDLKEVEKPLKDVEKGYSLTCEISLISKSLDNLVQVVTEYGPSAIEIFEPKKLEIGMGEAQNILNTVSMIMHQFAAAGMGGIVFVREKE